jgi:hypothetical protein
LPERAAEGELFICGLFYLKSVKRQTASSLQNNVAKLKNKMMNSFLTKPVVNSRGA